MGPVFRTVSAALLATPFLIACPVEAASSDPIGAFYQGKRISMYVGSEAAGGYNAYARHVTRHIGRYIPGEPTFIVQNMPGGGGLKMISYLYTVAPKDGTAMGTVQRGLLTSPLLEGRNIQIQYDPLRMNWLGSLNTETGLIVVWHTTPLKTMKDLFENELLVGSSSPSTDFMPLFLNNVLKTKFKIISGYKGSVEAYLAMERGETQGRVSTGWAGDKTILQPWLDKKQVRFLAQLGMTKHPDFPDVPLIMEFARTDRERQAMELILAAQLWGRPFVMPPEVPKERVAAMRKAFTAVTKDEEFLAEAKKMQMDLEVVSGEEIDTLLKRVYATPPDIVEFVRQAISTDQR